MFKITWVFIFQKTKPKHLKPTYLSSHLNKMKQKMKQFEDSIIQNKIDQIVVEDVYLQIILFLKSTFDILLSHN